MSNDGFQSGALNRGSDQKGVLRLGGQSLDKGPGKKACRLPKHPKRRPPIGRWPLDIGCGGEPGVVLRREDDFEKINR